MTKSLKKGADKRLTANFRQSEFDCKGVGCCNVTRVDTDFIKKLQGFRDYLTVRFGRSVSININSGYRCQKHNERIGGSSTSKHKLGKAADIIVFVGGVRQSAKRICQFAEDYGFDGIAYISATATHVDTRGYKWWADETKKNKAVSSFYSYFGQTREANIYSAPDNAVKRGSKGNGVKWVQWYLYCLGFYTGKLDGKCGSQTVKAIKAFQQKNRLTVDGSCGAKTQAKLKAVWTA